MKTKILALLLAIIASVGFAPIAAGATPVATTIKAQIDNENGSPLTPLKAGLDKAWLRAGVTYGDNMGAPGTLTATDGGTVLATTDVDSYLSTTVGPFTTPGRHTITVTYTPRDPGYAPSTATVTVDVLAVDSPVATKVQLDEIRGSSASSNGLVVNKDPGHTTACATRLSNYGSPVRVTAGTFKFYLDGALLGTVEATNGCAQQNLGVRHKHRKACASR